MSSIFFCACLYAYLLLNTYEVYLTRDLIEILYHIEIFYDTRDLFDLCAYLGQVFE